MLGSFVVVRTRSAGIHLGAGVKCAQPGIRMMTIQMIITGANI